MPDIQDDKTNEREVKLDPSQQLDWGDVDIRIDGKEPIVEDKKEDDKSADGDDSQDDGEEIEQFNEPDPIVLPADPGTYAPSDYSFEVETLDGVKTKINTPDEAEAFINKESDNLSVAQQLSLMRKTTAMESKLEKDKSDYDKKKTDFDSKKTELDGRIETINSIASEINYLISKGKLPAVDEKYMNTDWTDPLVSKQTGVKEQLALLTYMRDENDARAKAGIKPFSSVMDAYNQMELEKRDNTEVDVKKQQAQARKDASARVAGSSPNPVNMAPKGIAVGRALSLDSLESF